MKQNNNQLTDFFKHNLNCQDNLLKLSQILSRNFGIDDFSHLTIHENGLFANVSTNYEQWGHMWEQEHPRKMNFLIAPSQLRNANFLLEYDPDFTNLTRTFKDQYPQYHPFIMIRKEGKDKAHIFGFAARKQIQSLPSFYMNNVRILDSFIKYYLSLDEFSKHNEEHLIDIAAWRGKDLFYEKNYGKESLIESDRHSNFFKEIGIDPSLLSYAKSLTLRERQVLTALYNRKCAKESGKELGISYRTVQFYLENCKNKLAVSSREELLKTIAILQMAELLD